MADHFRTLRVAIATIINADSVALVGLHALMGRTPSGSPPTPATTLITTWRSMKVDGPFPIIAYQLLTFGQMGNNDDTRRGRVRFTVFAQGPTALAQAELVATRLEEILTSSAFLAQGVDLAPFLIDRLYLENDNDGDDEPLRGLERVDVEMDVEMVQAA